MNEYKQYHETSRDYERLWNLLEQGYEIACFVDYGRKEDFVCRDVCRARFMYGRIQISARGIEYGWNQTTNKKAEILESFEKINLEWIK